MKKILLTALVSAGIAGSALANTPCTFNGFYLGGGLNYMQEKFDFKATGATGSKSISLKGGGVKLFGGYGAVVSQGFYLGGELTLGFDRIVGSKKDKGFNDNKKVNYGVAGRAGYVFSNVLPYLKFGYEGRPSIASIRRSGFILGGGADVAVTRNVFLRAEYVHGFGSKKKVTLDATPGNIKPSTDTFLLGAAYRF